MLLYFVVKTEFKEALERYPKSFVLVRVVNSEKERVLCLVVPGRKRA